MFFRSKNFQWFIIFELLLSSFFYCHCACAQDSFDASLGEGQTLPAGIWRFRTVYKEALGSSGFDNKGQKTAFGYEMRIRAVAGVVELGWTERLSLQFMVPYIFSNRAGLNGEEFRKSQIYQNYYDDKIRSFIAELQNENVCQSELQCRKLIEGGFRLPLDREKTLETGENLEISSSTAVSTQLDSLILNNAAPSWGQTGLGDVEAGILYNVLRTDAWILSGGLGTRLPTGNFDVPSAQRPTGGGIWEIGLRLNADYKVMPGMWFSTQLQQEYPLTSATKTRSSLLDNTKFNTATPLNGASNKQAYEQRGIKHQGFVQINYGAGVMHPALNPLVVKSQMNFRMDRQTYLDSKLESTGGKVYSFLWGAALDGRPYGIPLGFDLEQNLPFAGEDVKIATQVTTISLKAFARF